MLYPLSYGGEPGGILLQPAETLALVNSSAFELEAGPAESNNPSMSHRS